MTPEDTPNPAVAVSPDDATSDRKQSDANQADNVAQTIINQQATADGLKSNDDKLDALLAQDSHAVVDNLNKLVVVSTALRETVDSIGTGTQTKLDEDTRHRLNFMKIMLGIAAATLLVMGVLLTITVQGVLQRDEILGCVKTAQPCYEKGLGAIVKKQQDDIKRVSTLAAICASGYNGLPTNARQAAIERCITVRLHK